MNKEGKFLKKPCSGVGGSVYQGKLVLSTEFKTKISHRKELKGWHFEQWPFVRAIGGIVGCLWVYMQKMELRY